MKISVVVGAVVVIAGMTVVMSQYSNPPFFQGLPFDTTVDAKDVNPNDSIRKIYASDEDGDDIKYSLEGDDAKYFRIDPYSGDLYVKCRLSKCRDTFKFMVKADDQTGMFAKEHVVIRAVYVHKRA